MTVNGGTEKLREENARTPQPFTALSLTQLKNAPINGWENAVTRRTSVERQIFNFQRLNHINNGSCR